MLLLGGFELYPRWVPLTKENSKQRIYVSEYTTYLLERLWTAKALWSWLSFLNVKWVDIERLYMYFSVTKETPSNRLRNLSYLQS